MNTQAIGHTITPSGHTAWERVQSAAQGEMLRITLNTAGTYNYFCEPHVSAGMTGTIVVQ
jgi:plastocyanin